MLILFSQLYSEKLIATFFFETEYLYDSYNYAAPFID